MTRIDHLRNFGIIAHIDSGKTTVSERILYLAGRIHAMGEVHHGTTILDSDPLSRDKGITIQAAVSSVTWREHHLNLIDTPGHVDFTAEVERSCRVLDGAVVVFCAVAGVQAQSETVWRQAQRHRVPCLLFINKADRLGADHDRVVAQVRERLGARPVLLTYPWMVPTADGLGSTLAGVVDVLHRRVLRFGGADDQRAIQVLPLPVAEHARCEAYHQVLVETAAGESADLLEQWSRDGDLQPAAIIAALRPAVATGTLHPVLCGSALATVGIQPLLDAIVDLLPDPSQARPALAKVDDRSETCRPDAAAPLRALVFKVVSTAHGELGFCRVYQGTLRAGDQVWCPNRHAGERIQRLVKLHGPERTPVTSIGPGDLCAVVGIRHAVTGDTLCPESAPAVLEGITFAEPVMGLAVEPETSADREALGQALSRLAREDPTFRRTVDAETGQLVISGMGELHLEVVAHRLVHQHHVRVRLGRPQVARRQRVTRSVESRGLYKVQNGGPGAFGDVLLRIRPTTTEEDATASDGVVFATDVRGGRVDREFFPAVEDGVRTELARGGRSGVRITGVHVTLVDGSMHVQDSNERAFAAAGALAVRLALGDLGLEVLEPWMHLDADTPAAHAGTVIGAINARRGQITDVTPVGDGMRVRAVAPMADLFGFTVALRSLTQGRGTCVLEPAGFRPA